MRVLTPDVHGAPGAIPSHAAGHQPFPRILSPRAAVIADVLRQLDAHARQPPAEQARIRDGQLGHLLRHAQRHSPFWCERLSAAADGSALALDRLPPLTRAEVQRAGPALRARTPGMQDRQILVARTSGSTGAPVEVEKLRPVYAPIFTAVGQLEQQWQGIDPAGLRCVIRDAPDGEHRVPDSAGPAGGAGARVLVRNLIAHPPEALLAWLRAAKPRYLVTVPAMAQRLAALARADGLGPQIEKIMVFSEAVTPALREDCRAAFGAGIVDRYSSEEVGWIALQCPKHAHLHVLTSLVHLEIVDRAGRPCPVGVPGRVLVTPLHAHAMPLVRYEIGDVAEWGPPCDCGLTLPVLRRVLGRRRNFLRLPDGTERLARLVGDHWQEMPEVLEFRVIQHGDGVVEAVLRCARPLDAAGQERARTVVRQALGHPFPVVVTEVERIDWGGRGWKREEFIRLDTPWPGRAPGAAA